MRLIKEYIRNILSEGMVTPSSVSSKYAIWTNYEKFPISESIGNQYFFIIIDHEALYIAMEEIWATWHSDTDSEEEYDMMDEDAQASQYDESVYDHIIAMLRVKDVVGRSSKYSLDCNGAWEVERSAADRGFGPTLYDMVMSIAPGGLVSDRYSVSNAALNYWEISANKRNDISKKFLDTPGNRYTIDPTDNCFLNDDNGAEDPEELIKFASRQLAIEFINLHHHELHYAVINKAPMDVITKMGNVGGDGYVELLVSAGDDIIQNEEIDLSTFGLITFDDLSDIQIDWEQYKLENEHDMYDNFVKEPLDKGGSILNLSYNTDYATEDFRKMVHNFDKFEKEARGLLGDDVFEIIFVYYINLHGNQFFDDKYYT